MPEAFLRPEWDDARIKGWAKRIGSCCAAVVDRIFDRVKVKEQAYNPALSVLNLSKKYGEGHLEAACAHALPRLSSPRYKHLKAILESNLDAGRAGAEPGGRPRRQAPRPRPRGRIPQGLGGTAMIDEETRHKLRELNMGEMVEALEAQDADRTTAAVPFDERVRMMVDYAYEAKRQPSVKRLVQRARLRFPDAEMGEMIYEGRGINGILIREAGTCQFMDSASNVVIEGCTGTGKSYLACCLAKQACKRRRSARYIRCPTC